MTKSKKRTKTKRPSGKKILGYATKKQQRGGFKIIEYFYFPNDTESRKRTIHKNLDFSTAETIVYQLEQKITK